MDPDYKGQAIAASPDDLLTCDDRTHFLAKDVVIPQGQNSVSLTLPLDPRHASTEMKSFRVDVESSTTYTLAPSTTPIPGTDARTSYPALWFYILDGVTAFAHGPNDPGKEEGVSWQDVRQGGLGDCFLCASLAAAVRADPGIIHNLIPNPEGTQPSPAANISFQVRLWNPDTGRRVTYPVVANLAQGFNSMRPTGDVNNEGQAEIWPWLIEQAYKRLKVVGGGTNTGINHYQGCQFAWKAITGGDCAWISTKDDLGNGLSDAVNLGVIRSALSEGKQVLLNTPATMPDGSNLVGGHTYLVTGNPIGNTLALYNPWGAWGDQQGAVEMGTKGFAEQISGIYVCSLPAG